MDDHRIVTHVRVVVHTMGRLGPNSKLSDNHWSIYLLINGNQSIRLNMAASPGYITGNLSITPYNYTLTNSAIKVWDFPTCPQLCVSHIVGLIYGRRRHLYNMSGGGSGCRYWVYVILQDLASMAWVAPDAPAQLWQLLLHRYSNTGATAPLDMVYGEFVAE